MTTSARASEQGPRPAPVPGIRNFAQVDAHLWRGGAPTAEGYRELAARGVRTVVDLRAEDLPPAVREMPIRAGLTVVHLPIRDGQVPTSAQVNEFLATVGDAQGPVFVHCGAGVGRTGSMSAAYLVATGQTDAAEATLRSLAIGPPTMEQIAFMRGLKGHQIHRPPLAVVAFSRIADSPRRSWSRLGL
ncbi:dual specificity protein phosphatase family protein [Actinomadura barringtoniae]|uniref:Dual specificity protein phosphatase family protein n=2 Tax=Actinomadura barringtoniae TaxID=1427535 RepID=A0A939PF22_9ACTN|nr:dual specificity protein phosphatase family protein [Actinomadura barringtoniae]